MKDGNDAPDSYRDPLHPSHMFRWATPIADILRPFRATSANFPALKGRDTSA